MYSIAIVVDVIGFTKRDPKFALRAFVEAFVAGDVDSQHDDAKGCESKDDGKHGIASCDFVHVNSKIVIELAGDNDGSLFKAEASPS